MACIAVLCIVIVFGIRNYLRDIELTDNDFRYLQSNAGSIIESENAFPGEGFISVTSSQLFTHSGRAYVLGDAKVYYSEEGATNKIENDFWYDITYATQIVKKSGKYKIRSFSSDSITNVSTPALAKGGGSGELHTVYGKVYDKSIKKVEVYDKQSFLMGTYYVGDKNFYFFEFDVDVCTDWSIRFYDVNNNLVYELN